MGSIDSETDRSPDVIRNHGREGAGARGEHATHSAPAGLRLRDLSVGSGRSRRRAHAVDPPDRREAAPRRRGERYLSQTIPQPAPPASPEARQTRRRQKPTWHAAAGSRRSRTAPTSPSRICFSPVIARKRSPH